MSFAYASTCIQVAFIIGFQGMALFTDDCVIGGPTFEASVIVLHHCIELACWQGSRGPAWPKHIIYLLPIALIAAVSSSSSLRSFAMLHRCMLSSSGQSRMRMSTLHEAYMCTNELVCLCV